MNKRADRTEDELVAGRPCRVITRSQLKISKIPRLSGVRLLDGVKDEKAGIKSSSVIDAPGKEP